MDLKRNSAIRANDKKKTKKKKNSTDVATVPVIQIKCSQESRSLPRAGALPQSYWKGISAAPGPSFNNEQRRSADSTGRREKRVTSLHTEMRSGVSQPSQPGSKIVSSELWSTCDHIRQWCHSVALELTSEKVKGFFMLFLLFHFAKQLF